MLTFPKSHILRITALDSLILLLGLALLAWPFATHTFPGSGDATNHAALGTLIATCAIFRILLAHRSLWIEFLIFIMGLITLSLPYVQHMLWNTPYLAAHLALGIALCLLSALSVLFTIPILKTQSPT